MAHESHTTGTGISQLDTEILRLRTYALSMTEEILKDVNDANEEVRENINGVANDINYGRSGLRVDLETTKNDSRNQYTTIMSTLSMMESFFIRHEFTRRQQQFAPGMPEPNKDRLKVPCQQHEDNKNQENRENRDNKSQEHGTSNSKSTSKFSPFNSRPPTLGPESLPKYEFSFNVVKRKTNGKGSSMPNKKPSVTFNDQDDFGFNDQDDFVNPQPRDTHTQVSPARELWPDLEMHDVVTPPANDFPDSKVSEAHESRPDSKMHDILTPPANSEMPGVDYDNPFPVPDSTPQEYATKTPRRVISAPLPEIPRSRRPTQLPSKLKDCVDPSTRQRNRRRRYDPFRPIELDKWLLFRDWYNNPNAVEKTIEGVYYNFKKPDVADPVWFETIYRPQQWLGISHLNAYMALLRDRMKTHPKAFKSNACILSHELSVFLTEAKTRKPIKSADLRVINVLNELRNLSRDSIVYTPLVHASHWVALVISIPLWKITVYDCMYFGGKNSPMYNMLQDMATYLSLTLKLNANLIGDPRTSQPFLVEQLDENACPQMDFPGDCGVFTAKYIEHMVLNNVELNDVTQENMDVFREKMCIDIFHHIVDV